MFDAPAHDHLRRRAGCQARRAVEGEQLRRHRAGRARPRRRHPRVLQHRLRAADARGRARQRGHPGQPPRRVGRAPGRAGRWCSAAATSPRSTWRWATAPSPTGACTTTRSSSPRSSRSTRTATSSVIDQAVPTGERVLTEEQADLVTYCLQEVVQDGTGASAGFGKPAAGKTGTTQDNKDAWFVGYTPEAHRRGVARLRGSAARRQRPDHGRGLAREPEPRPRRRHRRQPPGHDLAQVHGGGHPRASTPARSCEPHDVPGRVLHEELEQTTTTEADLVHQLHQQHEHHVDHRAGHHHRPRQPSTTTSTTDDTTTHDRLSRAPPTPDSTVTAGCAAWRRAAWRQSSSWCG